jgi:hypothetical protein
MPFDDQLYYNATASEDDYGYAPTNHLNVSRLVVGRAPWKKAHGSRVQKKKTLVLYAPQITAWMDSTASAAQNTKSALLLLSLHRLDQEGFKIYLYQSGHLTFWNKKEELRFKSQCIPESTVIKDSLKTLELSKDELFVLTDEAVEQLIAGNERDLQPFDHLGSIELILKDSIINPDELSRFLVKRGPQIETLNLSSCINLTSPPKPLKYDLPSLRKLILSDLANYSSYNYLAPYIREIQTVNSELINKLVAGAEQLTYLDLQGNRFVDPNVLDHVIIPQHLKVLLLSDIKISPRSLYALLRKANELVTLNLSHVSFSPQPHEPFNLNALEVLNLSGTEISIRGLSLLIAQAKKLKTLNLSLCNNLNDELSEEFYLEELEQLDLAGVREVSPAVVKNILSKTKSLRILNLSQFELITEELFNGVELSSLEELDLSYSVVNFAVLAKLLPRMPKLKKLSLDGCTDLGELNIQLNLNALEELNLSSSSITPSGCMHLLAHATALKKLQIDYCSNLHGSVEPSWELPLYSLEELPIDFIDGFPVGSPILGKVLAHAKRLRKLCLRAGDQLYEDITNELELDSLEELELRSSTLTLPTVMKFLAAGKALKKLIIQVRFSSLYGVAVGEFDCALLEEALFSSLPAPIIASLLKGTQLRKLEIDRVLDFSSVSISTIDCSGLEDLCLKSIECSEAQINQLFSSSRLKVLFIYRCEMGKLSTNIGAFHHLEGLNVADSNIDSSSLNFILSQAKHLKELSLYRVNLGAIEPEITLPNLTQLALDEVAISASSVARLLAQNTALTKLSLTRCTHLADPMIIKLNLIALEELNLNGSNINLASVLNILSQTNSLRVLHLSDCKNIGGVLPGRVNCSLIRALDLSDSNISLTTLGLLTEQAIKLTKLSLLRCQELGGRIMNTANLASLEELELGYSNITLAGLSQLISHAPNLKKINFGDCNNLDKEPFDDLNLNAVEELNFSGSSVTIETLVRILAKAKNLKRLYIDQCLRLHDVWPGSAQLDLGELELVRASGSSINSKALQRIIAGSKKNPKVISSSGAMSVQASSATPSGSKRISSVSASRDQTGSTVDADTSPQSTAFKPNKIFYSYDSWHDPDVSTYRLNTYTHLRVNPNKCALDSAFLLEQSSSDLALEDVVVNKLVTDTYDVYRKKAHLSTQQAQYFYGKQTVLLGKEWQPLASLSAQEQMTEYHLSDPNVETELCYSKRDNLYYIRLKPSSAQAIKEVDIDFIVQVPNASSVEFPQEIQNVIKLCRQFKANALHLSQTQGTGFDYLAALEMQEVGACRHRSVVFKHWMMKTFPKIPVRVISNEVHCFVELFYENQWVVVNLGGYPAKIDLQDRHKPKDRIDEPTVSTTLSPSGTTITYAASGVVTAPPPSTHYFLPDSIPNPPQTGKEYIQQLFRSEARKLLIQTSGGEGIAALRRGLEEYSKHTSRPCFYIHSPEDLITSAPVIERTINPDGSITGHLKSGPGGRLHDFLKLHQDEKPLLIVNYDNFTASDIVQFNALLDKQRKADTTPLPEAAVVIGLIDPDKPGAYDGEDFLSRFDKRPQRCPFSQEEFPPPVMLPPVATEHPYVIDLFGGSRWEERLLGYWDLSGTQLHFIEGDLVKALRNGVIEIDIRNAPWDNPQFARFWHEAFLHGRIQTEKGSLTLSDGVKITQGTGYPWDVLTQSISSVTTELPKKEVLVLNPTLFPQFFGTYTCDNLNHSINRGDGLLKRFVHQKITLYVTAPLSADAWAELLVACNEHDVTCDVVTAAGVTLPLEWSLKDTPQVSIAKKPWAGEYQPHTDCVITSTDIDVSCEQIKADLVIDVSELDYGSLLSKIQAHFNKELLTFSFNEPEGILLRALEQEKRIVLKGVFSDELLDMLNGFLVRRLQQGSKKGQITLVSEQSNLPSCLASFAHQVTANEKKELLGAVAQDLFSDKDYQDLSLAKLKAMHSYHQRQPQESMLNAWQGLMSLPPSTRAATPPKLMHAKELAEACDQARLKSVEAVLRQEPFVLLAGKTGVGKTTFIKSYWQKHHPALHIGEAAKASWAKDNTPGLKILFIDEANIASRQWSEFEGLYQTPPGIMINNQWVPLTADHKVIFAGNPLSYGGERGLPSLFQRHGNTVVFEPMTDEYLYDQVLEPLFKEVGFASEELAPPILKMAQFLSECSPDKVLVSARELAMVALMAITYCKNNPTAKPLDAINYFTYRMTKSLTPEIYQVEFTKEWGEAPLLVRSEPKVPFDFCLNSANQPALEALNDLLDFRMMRQQLPVGSTLAQGGLGGLLLEGEPGIGKSELVAKTLVAHGLKRGRIEQEHPNESVFYMMPVSMSFQDKKELLLKAFHEGAVVVIDEINSAPMMERLLNDLLMGATPEGELAKKPGFMIIGTQNPAFRAGRIRSSLALERRLEKVVVPEYTKEQMIAILVHKQLAPALSKELVSEYLYLRNSNRPEYATLCFRDLITRGEQLVQQQEELEVELEDEDIFSPKPAFVRSKAFFFTKQTLHKAPFGDDEAVAKSSIKPDK